MFRKILFLAAAMLVPTISFAQESGSPPQKPEVKVHMLNVCLPSGEDQQEIAAALSEIPQHPSFSNDFEIDRGRSVLDQNPGDLASIGPMPSVAAEKATADFVRIRHDLSGAGTYATVQYSFSRDREQMVETLVFRVRDPKNLLQLSIEDSASAVTSAAAMLTAPTPASRIKLERFGKSSIVLARCSPSNAGPAPDQSKYEPLFASASSSLADYRGLLGAKALIPEELARISRWSSSARKTAHSSE